MNYSPLTLLALHKDFEEKIQTPESFSSHDFFEILEHMENHEGGETLIHSLEKKYETILFPLKKNKEEYAQTILRHIALFEGFLSDYYIKEAQEEIATLKRLGERNLAISLEKRLENFQKETKLFTQWKEEEEGLIPFSKKEPLLEEKTQNKEEEKCLQNILDDCLLFLQTQEENPSLYKTSFGKHIVSLVQEKAFTSEYKEETRKHFLENISGKENSLPILKNTLPYSSLRKEEREIIKQCKKEYDSARKILAYTEKNEYQKAKKILEKKQASFEEKTFYFVKYLIIKAEQQFLSTQNIETLKTLQTSIQKLSPHDPIRKVQEKEVLQRKQQEETLQKQAQEVFSLFQRLPYSPLSLASLFKTREIFLQKPEILFFENEAVKNMFKNSPHLVPDFLLSLSFRSKKHLEDSLQFFVSLLTPPLPSKIHTAPSISFYETFFLSLKEYASINDLLTAEKNIKYIFLSAIFLEKNEYQEIKTEFQKNIREILIEAQENNTEKTILQCQKILDCFREEKQHITHAFKKIQEENAIPKILTPFFSVSQEEHSFPFITDSDEKRNEYQSKKQEESFQFLKNEKNTDISLLFFHALWTHSFPQERILPFPLKKENTHLELTEKIQSFPQEKQYLFLKTLELSDDEYFQFLEAFSGENTPWQKEITHILLHKNTDISVQWFPRLSSFLQMLSLKKEKEQKRKQEILALINTIKKEKTLKDVQEKIQAFPFQEEDTIFLPQFQEMFFAQEFSPQELLYSYFFPKSPTILKNFSDLHRLISQKKEYEIVEQYKKNTKRQEQQKEILKNILSQNTKKETLEKLYEYKNDILFSSFLSVLLSPVFHQ
jgi:hypothetical protein